MGWQQTSIIGNLGRDPEMKYTQAGKAVTSFSVAVTEKWTSNGEKREKTTWFRCTAWGTQAEICNQYLAKGSPVHIIGTIEAHAYTNNAGEASASLELTIRDIQFLGNRQSHDNDDAPDFDAAEYKDIEYPF